MINPALFAALLQSSNHTLIVAPTGYGKTLNLQPLARKFNWIYLNAAADDFALPTTTQGYYVIDHAHLLEDKVVSGLLHQIQNTYVLAVYHSFYSGIPKLLQENRLSIIDHHLLSLGAEQGKKLGLSAAQMAQSQGWPFLCLLMSESLLSVDDYLDSLIAQLSKTEINLLSKIGHQPIARLEDKEHLILIDILNKGIPLLATQRGLRLIPAFYTALRRHLSKQGYTLRLTTLGHLEIQLDNQSLQQPRIGKNPLLLLVYLIFQQPTKRSKIEEQLFNGKANYATQAMSLLKGLLKPYFDEQTLAGILSTKDQIFSVNFPDDIQITSDITEFLNTFTAQAPIDVLEQQLRKLQPFLPEYDCQFTQEINLQLQDRLLETLPALLEKAPTPLKARELLLLCLRFTGYDPEISSHYHHANEQLPRHLQQDLPNESQEDYASHIEQLLKHDHQVLPINASESSQRSSLISE